MTLPLNMTGRRMLVAGASSGIGRAAAMLLSQLGARVTLVARNRERLAAAQQELTGEGHSIEVFDLSQYEGIPAWMLGLARTHGPFDGVLDCAGKYLLSPLKVLDATQAEALWRVNVFAGLWLAKGFRQPAAHTPSASLVLVASSAGLIGQPGLAAYSASKGAVVALTRSLATELARERIRVNCVAPSNLKTAMTDVAGLIPSAEEFAALEREHPLGFGEAQDVAHAAAYLLSPAAKWITGTTLVLDGGYTAH